VIPSARRALRRLSALDRVHVALLSGRTALDLAVRVRVGGALYLGNHGIEHGSLPRHARAESLRVTGDPSLDGYELDAARIAGELPALVPESWLIVERKGPAVAFHFRAAPDVPAAAARVLAAVDSLDPGGRFVRYRGRRILELRPPGAGAKGEAFRALVSRLRPASAFVLGDDASDAEAFRALREMRAGGRIGGLAIGVMARPDLPETVTETADVLLASPLECARFLSALSRHG
jgi:trehalose-phosphatase